MNGIHHKTISILLVSCLAYSLSALAESGKEHEKGHERQKVEKQEKSSSTKKSTSDV